MQFRDNDNSATYQTIPSKEDFYAKKLHHGGKRNKRSSESNDKLEEIIKDHGKFKTQFEDVFKALSVNKDQIKNLGEMCSAKEALFKNILDDQ